MKKIITKKIKSLLTFKDKRSLIVLMKMKTNNLRKYKEELYQVKRVKL